MHPSQSHIIDVLEFSKEDNHTDGIETFVVPFTSSGLTFGPFDQGLFGTFPSHLENAPNILIQRLKESSYANFPIHVIIPIKIGRNR